MSAWRDWSARGEGRGALVVALTSWVLALGGSGCTADDGDDDGAVETTHLHITTTTGNPICAGTPLLLESEVVRIAEALELPLWPEDDKLEVRFGEDSVAETCDKLGLGELNGCSTMEDSGSVVAAVEIAGTAPHELVHAVRRHHLPKGHPLFEEGLAEVLSGSDGFPRNVSYPHGEPYYSVEEMLGLASGDPVFYDWGASFVSWLWETNGRSTLMSFMNDPRMPDDATMPLAFEDHFGQSLVEADQAWAVDERPDPAWGAPCLPERTYSLADGPVEISGDFDCSEPTIYGAAYFMSTWPMCLEIPETTRVRISLEADHGSLSVQTREPCDAGAPGAEALRDKYLDAGDILEEDISGCRHRMTFNSQEPGFPPTPYTIRIEEIAR